MRKFELFRPGVDRGLLYSSARTSSPPPATLKAAPAVIFGGANQTSTTFRYTFTGDNHVTVNPRPISNGGDSGLTPIYRGVTPA